MANYFEGANLPVVAANFDYFRLAPEKWTLMLNRLAQLGVNTLVIPVPWGFHQFQPNTIDLTGATAPRRNLTLLLKLCAGLNFTCLLQPGPHLPNLGILNDGRPVWLAATDPFEPAAERWLATLAKTLAGMQWPAGPVAGLWLNFPAQNSSEAGTDAQLTEVKWPIWLRKRYQTVEALNEAVGGSFRSVSQAEFPREWSTPLTPLQQLARAFLAEVEQAGHNRYQQALAGNGWQTPAQPFDALPPLKPLADFNPADPAIFVITEPIEIDPAPPDVSSAVSWAEAAPLCSDGSLRPAGRAIRQQVWQRRYPGAQIDGSTLAAPVAGGGFILPGQNIELKIDLPAGVKPAVFQLLLNGGLTEAAFTVARGKLRGNFLAEADLVVYLENPAEPLAGELAAYFSSRLAAQRATLVWSANQAQKLGQAAAVAVPPEGGKPQPKATSPLPATITEARRGLSKAEAALKKAVASISGLEAGFDTVLDKPEAALPQPAPEAVTFTAEIFEVKTQTELAQIGEIYAGMAGQLKTAAAALQQTLAGPFTIEQYRQAHQLAVNAAQTAGAALGAIIAQLRLEIAAEQLPLVAWRLHDQTQTIADTLRWGILRR